MRFRLEPRGPFSLAESARFAGGFSPTAHSMRPDGDGLLIAFVPDGEDRSLFTRVRQEGDAVEVEADRDPSPRARDQIARILSLDVDGSGFPEIARRDPAVGALQERWPGFRPVSFPSPLEAGAWFLLSQRMPARRAIALKERIAEELGEAHGDLRAFPHARALASLGPIAGLPEVKRQRLVTLGEAAAGGALDGERLRAAGAAAAIEELGRLPGVGDFTAQGIVVRGAGEPDWVATAEPRLAAAMADAYSLPEPPGPAEVERIAEGWRPYRSWVTVLLRRSVQ